LMTRGGSYTPIYEATADFDLAQFVEQLLYALRSLCDRVLDRGAHETNVAFFLSDHLLLSLNENELNYLPIWADGLDDGSGGVFQDTIPPTEMGPSEPGPAYHTGHTVGTDATTDYNSDLGIGDLDIYSRAGDTVRSMDAQQSVTTGPGRYQIVPLSDAGFESDSCSVVENEYADARYVQPAQHQAVGQALASYVEGTDTEDVASAASGEDAAWSDVGSVVGVGLVVSADTVMDVDRSPSAAHSTDGVREGGATARNTTTGKSTTTAAQSGLDGFGLDDDEDMLNPDDDDDDDTSTLDGSEYDLISLD
jgi:hypothetical protein